MKKNNKGMTLVECIIAMCILGVIAAMFVTIAVKAKKENLYNYKRSNTMYKQAAAAENFNTEVHYGTDCKISKILTGGAGSAQNKFDLSADFGTVKFDATAYGYEVKRVESDEDKSDEDKKDENYKLRFFRSDDAGMVGDLDPSSGKLWLKIYNDTGAEITTMYIATPTEGGGTFYYDEGPLPGERSKNMPNGSIFSIGLQLSSTPSSTVFTISQSMDINSPSHVGTGDISFDEASFANYLEVKNGKVTGKAIFHICSDGVIRNQADFDAM